MLDVMTRHSRELFGDWLPRLLDDGLSAAPEMFRFSELSNNSCNLPWQP